MLDSMGKGYREDGSNDRRREITLHSFRRFVKTTISDGVILIFLNGSSDIVAQHIGVKRSQRKRNYLKKLEPYLTFLNIHQLERQGADIQSKVEELEELNQALRNRDKMKDDAIAQLSDQVMALTARMQELERKQQLYTS